MNKQVLRSFCTYILLIALTLQSFYRNIMVMDYQINLPEYLAKCINKDKPELHCDGQCVLMKKVEEKEKKETKKNMVVYEYSAFYLHNEHVVLTIRQTNEEPDQKQFLGYLNNYTFQYNAPIFRPPIC